VERPIENDTLGLLLLRLEFEVFLILEEQHRLSSLGKLACRDIVLAPGVDPETDGMLAWYATALDVSSPYKLRNWRQRTQDPAWVKIVFAELDGKDYRNPFKEIKAFDLQGWTVLEYDYLANGWVKVGQAADDLNVSNSTIIRRVDLLAIEWGERLLIRPNGKDRIINLPLLRMLLPVC